MSGSSYCPMSAVYVHGTAPLSRIHATATEVSRPPEKAIPTRSPTGRDVRTLDTVGQPTGRLSGARTGPLPDQLHPFPLLATGAARMAVSRGRSGNEWPEVGDGT